MSFILDALKKSENERQRQVGPSLADLPVSRRPSDRPWWVVAVAALLVVNLAVLLIVLTRADHASNAPAAAPAGTPAAPAAGPQMRSENSPTSPAVRSLADEASIDDVEGDGLVNPNANLPNDQLAAAATAGPSIVRPIDAPQVAPAPVQPDTRYSGSDNVPTALEASANGANIPEMRLDFHVYSPQVDKRFIFINMHKYTEGQTLAEGPIVERITPEGVILNQRGLRYLVPRQ